LRAGIVASPDGRGSAEKTVALDGVPQSYAVWPHKTVFENLAYGCGCGRMDAAMISAKVTDALATVRMEACAKPLPERTLRRTAAARGAGTRARPRAGNIAVRTNP